VSRSTMAKAEAEWKRNETLYKNQMISESVYVDALTSYDIAKASYTNSLHRTDMAQAGLDRAAEDLSKTTIYSPLSGTISKLNSQLGERVVGTATYQGTEVMTISDLDNMEARVDIGEIDVVLIKVGQKARLEVDSFRDKKFTGFVSEIANTAKTSGGGSQQEATKFEVKVRIQEKEAFRPGMSVTAEVETRYRTNVLTVPIQSVTTRLPKAPDAKKDGKTNAVTKVAAQKSKSTNSASIANASQTNALASVGSSTNASVATSDSSPTNAPSTTITTNTASTTITTNTASTTITTNTARTTNSTNTASTTNSTNVASSGKKANETPKPIEVVFAAKDGTAQMVPIKRGISDDDYVEITEGLTESQEIISGGYKAINRELEDGKKIKVDNLKKDTSSGDKKGEPAK